MNRRTLGLVALAILGTLGLGGAWLATHPGALLGIVVRQERSAARLQERHTHLLGHDIAYLDGGVPTGPTVVLLHGFAADKDNWTRFSGVLSDAGFHLLAPDLPGHGASSRLPETTYDIPTQVEFVEAFRRDRGLEAMHLAGNSMGGHIAAAYAATHPERVSSLGLIAPGGVTAPVESERNRLVRETGANPLLVNDVADFDRFLAFVFVVPPRLPRVVKQHFADEAVRHRAFNDKIYRDISGAGRLMPLEPLLPSIACPTLIVWGDSDRVLDPSGAGVFAAGIRDQETVLMKDMGHSPMIERPDETAAIYLTFLERSIDDETR